MRFMLCFLLLLNNSLFSCYKNHCKKVCHDIRKYVQMCENLASDKFKSPFDLPHCGLTDFSDVKGNG